MLANEFVALFNIFSAENTNILKSSGWWLEKSELSWEKMNFLKL